MRANFFKGLYDVMKEDERVMLLMSDTGAMVLDEIKKDFPDRYMNVGIAEANMVGVATGLALCGKIVYVYAIIPFVTMKVFEHYRVDVICQNLPVKLIGVGAGLDYCTLGPTHHAHEDYGIMRTLPDLTIFSPCDEITGMSSARLAYDTPGPVYVRLERYGKPEVYKESDSYNQEGFNYVKLGGRGKCIIATGKMVVTALEVAKIFEKAGVELTVVDLFRIKPLSRHLIEALKMQTHVFTLEEHTIVGGIGSAIAEIIAEYELKCKFKRIGLPDQYCRKYGTREYLHKLLGLDAESVVKKIGDCL